MQDRGQQLRALRAREEVRRRRHLEVAVHRAAVRRVGLSAAARLGELGVAVLALAQLSHLAAKLGRLVDDHALLDLGLELRRHPDALGLLGEPAQPGPDHEEELPAAARVRDQLGLQADVRRLDARHEQLGREQLAPARLEALQLVVTLAALFRGELGQQLECQVPLHVVGLVGELLHHAPLLALLVLREHHLERRLALPRPSCRGGSLPLLALPPPPPLLGAAAHRREDLRPHLLHRRRHRPWPPTPPAAGLPLLLVRAAGGRWHVIRRLVAAAAAAARSRRGAELVGVGAGEQLLHLVGARQVGGPLALLVLLLGVGAMLEQQLDAALHVGVASLLDRLHSKVKWRAPLIVWHVRVDAELAIDEDLGQLDVGQRCRDVQAGRAVAIANGGVGARIQQPLDDLGTGLVHVEARMVKWSQPVPAGAERGRQS